MTRAGRHFNESKTGDAKEARKKRTRARARVCVWKAKDPLLREFSAAIVGVAGWKLRPHGDGSNYPII